MAFDGQPNRGRGDRLVLLDRQPQRVLDGILAVVGRQLQDLQVFAGGCLGAVITQQLVVGHAEVAGGKHVGVILVVRQCAGLADQRVDHVTVVNGVFAVARQARHRLNPGSRPPDFNYVSVNHDIDLPADQPAGNRIRVAPDLNRAAAVNLDPAHVAPMIELARRQLAQVRLLLLKLVGAGRVPLVDQPGEKLFVLSATGKVAIAAQMKSLVDCRFQMAVRRFDVPILMRLAGVGPLGLDLVVVH
jgi:hypothetical protein